MSLVDLQLNIKPAAWAVLHRLSEVEAPDALAPRPDASRWRTTTWAWYNGHERGISLVVERYISGGKVQRLVVVFGECRSSDSIFVDSWDDAEGDYSDGPKVEHMTVAAYEKRKEFPTVDTATEHVRKLVEKRVGQSL